VRAVVQRCCGARVLVAGEPVGGFAGPGLLVLVGATHTDDEPTARRLADKVYGLRIFDGPQREASAADLGLPLLVISQFTLYGDARKGRRPTWEAAAPAGAAEPLVAAVVARLRAAGAQVSTGVFGADMQVESTNDGPFTVLLEI
jgi:D-tyrosyl-tRNA(Tyr) deacylase